MNSRSARRTGSSRPALRPLVAGLGAVVAVAVLAGCTPPTSDGGQVIVTDDERIPEVRAAREALAEPVPTLVAEAERLVEALGQLWATEAPADERADLAASLRLEPLQDALAVLAEVELEGAGPDVAAAQEVVDAMLADGRTLEQVVEGEVASLTTLPAFDDQLEGLLARWDARGSYSQQLTAFEETAAAAIVLAEEAAVRTTRPACTGLWERRSEAARTVAERTDELRGLVRDRRGQEFDELRDGYRQDPYGLGGLLGELDAAAAAQCWAQGSDAPGVVDQLQSRTDELGDVLDPEDLQG